VAAVTAGNALEFYDFLTYAYFAGQIGRTFFPSADPTGSLLASLAAFGAGFLMRPVGALVIGVMGDRSGRKPAMLLTFALMGLSMVGLALIPSYRSIGVAAPALAVLCRLVQGFALGGEVGPTTAFLIEAAPARQRGFYVSLQFMSQRLSTMITGLVGLALASALPDAALDAWGWRAAFLIGALIVPVGFLLRRDLPETLPAAATEREEPAPAGAPGVARIALLGGVMLAAATIATYVLTYLTTYASATLHMSTRVSFLPTFVGGLAAVAATPAAGWASDKVGRKPLMIGGTLALLLVAIPGFWLLETHRTALVLTALAVVLAVLSSFGFVPMMATVTEALPMRVRSGALGVTYALAISIFGGTTQFAVAWLTNATGSPLAPAWYMTGALAIGILGVLMTPETAPAAARRPPQA
jgi:MFS family permease